jgi:hypothetical protein
MLLKLVLAITPLVIVALLGSSVRRGVGFGRPISDGL